MCDLKNACSSTQGPEVNDNEEGQIGLSDKNLFWIYKLITQDRADDLTLEKFNGDALGYVFDTSVSTIAPKCLDAVLKFAKQKSVTFMQFSTADAHPFSTLISKYLYKIRNASVDREQLLNKNLVDCLQTLLDHGFIITPNYQRRNVLHSFLAYKPDTIPFDIELKCFSLLLEAGSNPNYRHKHPIQDVPMPNNVHMELSTRISALISGFNLNLHKEFVQVLELFVKYGFDTSACQWQAESDFFLEYGFNTPDSHLCVPGLCDYFIAVSCVTSFRSEHAEVEVQDMRDHVALMCRTVGCFIYGGDDLVYGKGEFSSGDDKCYFPLDVLTSHFVEGYGAITVEKGKPSQSWEVVYLKSYLGAGLSFLKFIDITFAQRFLEKWLNSLDDDENEAQSFDNDLERQRAESEIPNMRTIIKDVFAKNFLSFFSLETICLVKVWKCAGKRFTELDLPINILGALRDMLHLTF